MSADFQVPGRNPKALFKLRIHRGEGMALLAMNWKAGTPPADFVGFAIEYKEPGGDRFFTLRNRIAFPGSDGKVDPDGAPTLLAPIQKFRWVHFPRNAELPGDFVYRVTPVFMNAADELSYGEPQTAALELRRETYPGKLNVTFTRGFVSSQAFVDQFAAAGKISTLLPERADEGLDFKPTHPKAEQALAWMGFEARRAILELLDEAIADTSAQVRVIAYDLSEPDVVARLERLGPRLKVLIDDDGDHGAATSGETQAQRRLEQTAGAGNVKRQHMGGLQHNKTIVVDGSKVRAAICGSTNFSWRGFFVQSNNAVVVRGKRPVKRFNDAFDAYFEHGDDVAGFGASPSAQLTTVGLTKIDAQLGFSPYATKNALLARIAKDIRDNSTSSVFYSLAFLFQTPGPIKDAIKAVTDDARIFVYGISDKKVGGLDVQKPSGNVATVSAAALGKNAPEPFKSEPAGGGGIRMHHKFVVVDFDKPTARVYLGSYNFSAAADEDNGENLLLIRDRRVAVAYTVEAIRIFDHYHFRVAQQEARTAKRQLVLGKPPRTAGEVPWWQEHYTDRSKIRDRELFA